MEAATEKLARGFKLAVGVAQSLVTGGFRNPGQIKAATDAQLLALPRFDQDVVDEVRAKVG